MEIRVATVADAPEIAAIYAPIVEDTYISFEEVPPTEAETAERIAKTLPRLPYLVAQIDGRVAGFAYSSVHRERSAYRWSVDCSVYVHPDFRRRGVASALYDILFPILKALGYQTVFAGITQPNEGSVAVHQSMGFQSVGTYRNVGFKQGKWHDVAWFGLPIGEFTEPPADPKPFNGGQ